MAVDDIYNAGYFIKADDFIACSNQTFYEKVARVGTVAEVTQQLGDFLDNLFWTVFWQPWVSDDFSYDRTECQKIFPTRDAPYTTLVSRGQAGGDIGKTAMNGTTAVLIAQYSQTWAAWARGRMYLTGLPEASASLGRIFTAPLNSLQSNYAINFGVDIVLPAPADVTLRECVFSPSRAHPPGDPPPPPILPVYSEVTTAIVRPRIATQRRRRTPIAASI